MRVALASMDSLSLGQSMAFGDGNSPTGLHHPGYSTGVLDSSMDEYGFISSHWIVKEDSSFASMLRFSIYIIVGIVSVVDRGSLAMLSSNINNFHDVVQLPLIR